MRRAYRKEFGLSAKQMDDELVTEVNYMLAIMQLEAKRQKKDNKAMERNPHNGKHN